uniref:Uncharacterized protein n=1 Tax=Arundo donax TaxID=35708 RepID=A0A0A9EE84_ARUDO
MPGGMGPVRLLCASETYRRRRQGSKSAAGISPEKAL